MVSDGLMKILLTSGFVSSIAGGAVGWLASNYQIERELQVRQGESGYEALINSNTMIWESEALARRAAELKDSALANQAMELRRKADNFEAAAQYKIAAYGHEKVVNAMADYYAGHLGANVPCGDMERARTEVRIFQAMRDTVGAPGQVTDRQMARLINECTIDVE